MDGISRGAWSRARHPGRHRVPRVPPPRRSSSSGCDDTVTDDRQRRTDTPAQLPSGLLRQRTAWSGPRRRRLFPGPPRWKVTSQKDHHHHRVASSAPPSSSDSCPFEQFIERRPQLVVASAPSRGVCNHEVPAVGPWASAVEVSRCRTQLAAKPVPDHRWTHLAADGHREPCPRSLTLSARRDDQRENAGAVAGCRRCKTCEHRAVCDPFQHRVVPTTGVGTIGFGRLRPTAEYDRDGDEPSRSTGRHASTCGAESRACGHDGVCWADRYASP